MYLIALCDDETEQLHITERMLTEYLDSHPKTDFRVDSFENADALLKLIGEEAYFPDLILMDIYMPGKLGIEAARELRDLGTQAKIIFLTTSRDHALEAFDVEASQYLVKPITDDKLFAVLDRFLREDEASRRKYLLLRVEGKIQRIVVHDIVHCEAQGKSQYLYLSDGTQYNLRRTLTELYEQLAEDRRFVRVGVAYIVNLEYIESLSAREIKLDNGKKIFLPRGSFHPLRERYFNYYCEDNKGL